MLDSLFLLISSLFQTRRWGVRMGHMAVMAFFMLLAGTALADKESAGSMVKTDINWPEFLKSRNMVWKKAPDHWDNAPFTGNGFIGMHIKRDPEEKGRLRVDVARMDAQEHLPMSDSSKAPGGWSDWSDWAYKRYRVPLGYFFLDFKDELRDWDLRLDLWNAEIAGTVTTGGGRKLSLRAYTHATQPLIVVELEDMGEKALPELEWNGFRNESPRTYAFGAKRIKEAPDSAPGPEGQLVRMDRKTKIWKLPLRPRGVVAVAWTETSSAKSKKTFFISIDHSYPDNDALKRSANLVRKASVLPSKTLTDTHRAWWHRFYPESFLSIPDDYWDSFYWAQIYKLGAGMRANGPVLDLQGPWLALPVNAWPGVWWNLNVQLTYWPCYTGNRLGIAESLPNNLRKNRRNLIENVTPEYRGDSAGLSRAAGQDSRQDVGRPNGGPEARSEVGSLPWACHNLFLHYRMTMNDKFLEEDVYPLLRRAINYYIHFLEKRKDGRLHLPSTLSPEYGVAPDANYDLALLRWGCRTLLWSAERLGIKDPLIPKWKSILQDLTDYPVDGNGYMVGRGVPFKNPHRHYSHLFMVYPLHLVDTSRPEEAELVDKSIRHWHSLKSGLRGYSFTGGASLYAKLLRGDDALEIMGGLKSWIRPNTLYKEGQWPVIETPLSGAASLHDMVLQSWNDVVNVLPAVPGAWKNVSFHRLRAEGAFLVSAERRDGVTRWIHVKSLAGEPLRLRTGMAPEARLSGTGAAAMKKDAGGDWVGTPPKGSELLLAVPGANPVVTPVRTPNLKVFGRP